MLVAMGQTGNATLHGKANSEFSSKRDRETSPASKNLVEVLSELRSLLEDYAPWWYTEEHHRRVESALHATKKY